MLYNFVKKSKQFCIKHSLNKINFRISNAKFINRFIKNKNQTAHNIKNISLCYLFLISTTSVSNANGQYLEAISINKVRQQTKNTKFMIRTINYMKTFQ